MDFVSIRIITADVRRLVAFYSEVTGVEPKWATEDFAELKTSAGTLAIAHERTMRLYPEGLASVAHNRSVILELRVRDVDAEYARIVAAMPGIAQSVVLQPTTMPWGNRSLLFRDPDGNLVNVFATSAC